MSTQYRLVQSGKTASGGCSAGPRFVRAVAPRIIIIIIIIIIIGISEHLFVIFQQKYCTLRSKYITGSCFE
jgi:hypothetical protein